MRAAFLSVWAVIVSAAFLQAASGLQSDLLGVRAGLAGFADWTIGLMMAAYYVSYSGVPLTAHYVIGRLGQVLVIVICALAAAAVIVVHPLLVTPMVWTGLRMISGFAMALIYVAYESWINGSAPNALRGRLFSIYMIVQMVTMTAAQYLFSLGDPRRMGLFVLTGALFAFAALPVALVRRAAPASVPPEPLSLVKLFRLSPLGASVTALAGLCWATVATFGPVYAQHIGFGLGGIGLFMALALIGGGALMFPLAWLSDTMGRRPVLASMFAAGLAASLFGLWAVHRGAIANDVAALLAGAFVFPLYGISVAHANDAVDPGTRVAAAAGLVLLFGLGSIFGPLLCGWAMTAMGPGGFFAVLAASMAAGAAAAAKWG